jgi:hypothetical protein
MPKSFDCTVESSISIQQMHAAYSELDYWLARLAPHNDTVELRSFDVDASGAVRITIVQDLRHLVLPAPFGRLYPRGLELVQSETWTVDGGTKVCGEIHVQARGAPGSGRSTVVLVPTQNGERFECSGTIQCRVPLVGRKLESIFGRQMMDQIPETLRSITEWVNGRA